MSQPGEKYILIDVPAYLPRPWMRFLYGIIRFPFEWLFGLRLINWGYDQVSSNSGGDTKKFLEEWQKVMKLKYEFPPEEELDRYRKIEGPLVFVANHPFGGIEALPFIQLLFKIRPEFQVIVNFLLNRFRELQPVFLAVDPYGTPEAQRKNLSQIKKIIDYLRAGKMIGVFPAGEVSSYKPAEKAIRDGVWDPAVFRIFQKTNATIVPVYFAGRNSLLFQIIGFTHPFVRTAFLPIELVRSVGKEIRYKIGEPLKPEDYAHLEEPEDLAAFMRGKTYELEKYFKKG